MQLALATFRADARITSVFARWIELWREGFVEDIEHFGDAQLACFGDGDGEIAPKTLENFFVVTVASRNIIKLVLKRRCELVADVFAEEVQQKYRNDAAFVFGEKTVLFFAHIFAVLDRGDNAGVS